MTTWFVTGAARGLGYEVAIHALGAGANVVATARDLSQVEEAFADAPGCPERLLPVALDVTDERQAVTAVDAASARFGSIDVLVNNAGRGLLGAVEEASASEVEAVFATNVFGPLNVTRAVLPHRRAAHSGDVVNVSSMGGFAQVAGWGVYGATKFAVEGLSEAMQAELSPIGIKVTIIEPGSSAQASSMARRCTPRRMRCRTTPPPQGGCVKLSPRATAVSPTTRPRAQRRSTPQSPLYGRPSASGGTGRGHHGGGQAHSSSPRT